MLLRQRRSEADEVEISTFTLAAAIGAKALARLGVLPTRLSAVDEAATLDVLCSPTAAATAHRLEEKGFRVLAVAVGTPAAMRLAGMIALSDPSWLVSGGV